MFKEDLQKECIDIDPQIMETLQWLLASDGATARERSRLFLLLDPEEDGQAEQLELKRRLTARKQVILFRQFEQVLAQKYKEELQEVSSQREGEQSPSPKLQSQLSPSPRIMSGFREAGEQVRQQLQMATRNPQAAFTDALVEVLVRTRLNKAKERAVQDHLDNETVRTLQKTFTQRTVEEIDTTEQEEGTDTGSTSELSSGRSQAETERKQKLSKLISAGPFVTLAFDVYDSGLVRVRMKNKKLQSLKRMSAFILFLGLLIFIAVFWLSLGTLELLLANFDSTGLPSAARLSHAIFFPPTECDASGPGGGVYLNQIYAVLMLAIWTPATCIGAVVLTLWVISLNLATALVADDIDDLIRELDPGCVAKYFAQEGASLENVANWKRKVELPGAMLVSTMEQLSSWGVAMGLAIISCACLSVGLLPTAVATRSHETMVVLVLIGTLLPALIVCELLSYSFLLYDEAIA